MQQQLQQHISERTHMLAAITHDLQTPLTRLRLRFETIEDSDLRERCIRDLMEMRSLIEEGLELARSSDTSESFASVELDTLLESVVEDAVEAGHNARIEGHSGATVRMRPLAGRRLISNLVDNAIKYGNTAVVSARRDGDGTIVSVRDRGPGLPVDMLNRVFEPFFRIENSRSRSTGGVGLGLTVAKMLADQNGAALSLRNHPEGGLECLLIWRA
jgi:signal transduction histidine kinase